MTPSAAGEAEPGAQSTELIVDSLDLAYVAFQLCRNRGCSDRTLDAARYALERASQAGTLEVEIPDGMLRSSEASRVHQLRADRANGTRTRLQDFSAEQQQLFALTRLAAAELKELCSTTQSPALTRCVGYALHNLPGAARSGSWYSNEFFQFGFRQAAFFWTSLPVGMRHLLCQLADIDVEGAEYLIKKRGFVIPSRGSSGGVVPWSEVQLVEDWTDPDAN